MDSTQTFQVVLHGLKPNVSEQDAKMKLATLFKATPEQTDRLLATQAYVVKKGVLIHAANNYKIAIEAAGGVCAINPEEAEIASLDVDLPPLGSSTSGKPSGSTTTDSKMSAAAKMVSNDDGILFQGDVSLLKSTMNIVQGEGIGTAAQFVFYGGGKGDVTLKKDDVASAEEIKHGWSTKWSVKTKAGETYQFQATNQSAFRLAMLTLSGQEITAELAQKEPNMLEVKNNTAWAAAFSIWIAGLLAVMLSALMGWNWENATTFQALKIWVFFKLPVIYLFLRIDHLKLQSQGFNTEKLGIVPPEKMHLYLWSRANAFGHGKGYAMVFYVTFALDVLLAIFG